MDLSGRLQFFIKLESSTRDKLFCQEKLQLLMPHKGQIVLPRKITTFNATKIVKESTKIKDSSLYAKIVDPDLIAKEFKYHQVSSGMFSKLYQGISFR